MPDHGELTNQEKVTSVLAHRGWPKSTIAKLTDAEEARCVEIYDKHVVPMTGLNEAFDKFWFDHRERLDKEKAATDDLMEGIETTAKSENSDKSEKPAKSPKPPKK